MNGQGEYHYKNGDIYTGEWREDQKHGEGTYYVDEDQIKQVGQWVNNNMEGEFKIYESDSTEPQIVMYKNNKKVTDNEE